MFNFLKKKLKSVVSSFSKKIDEQGKEEKKEILEEPEKKPTAEELLEESKERPVEKIVREAEEEKELKEEIEDIKKEIEVEKEKPKSEEIKEIKKEIKEIKEKVKEVEKERKEPIEEKSAEFPKEEETPKEEPKIIEKKESEIPKEEKKPGEIKPEEKKGFFAKLKQKVVTKKIDEKQFDDLFWDLELALLENNVAVEVIEKIKQDLKQNLVDKPISRTKITKTITDSLNQTIEGLFDIDQIDLLEKAKQKKPLVICFVGINGSGKTTTIAKIAKFFEKNKMSCVLAASDTFRAAAIDQLQKHADNLGIKLIKHDYGSDAAAVAFDAIKHAQAKNIDAVLIDTAGRIHSNVNLMDEMKKIIRVAKPDLKIFVGESITGNDCTEQANKFNEAVGIDGIILSKADIDEKGGAAISVSHVTGKPILFLGVGQGYEDLKEFDKRIILNNIGL
ncbi:signal recognition particle-docking protein FtsY [Candidatus Woesearchaeota archaeon]|nr:signal recognition particle-docking protein FtsY [Candidatus Woesearchaeota archaeon]